MHPVASQTAPEGMPNEMEQKTPARARPKAPNSPPCLVPVGELTGARAGARVDRSKKKPTQARRAPPAAVNAWPMRPNHRSQSTNPPRPWRPGQTRQESPRAGGCGRPDRGFGLEAFRLRPRERKARGGQRNNGGGFGILGAKRARGRPTRSARPLALGPDLPGASLPYSGSFNCLRGSTRSQNRSNTPYLDRSSAGLGPKARSCEAKGLARHRGMTVGGARWRLKMGQPEPALAAHDLTRFDWRTWGFGRAFRLHWVLLDRVRAKFRALDAAFGRMDPAILDRGAGSICGGVVLVCAMRPGSTRSPIVIAIDAAPLPLVPARRDRLPRSHDLGL